MSKNSYIIIGLIVVVVIVGFLVFGNGGSKTDVSNTTPTTDQTQPTTPTIPTAPATPAAPAPAAQTTISVPLAAQNNSKETGTVTLTAKGEYQTEVMISLSGAPATAQPAHIHKGTCDKLDANPAYPLTDVVNGKSDSTVSASIASLSTGGFSINVHKSAKDIKTYVACGTIPASAPGAASPVVPPTAPANY